MILAMLSMMIVMALGLLSLSITTGDLKITGRVVGEKKAATAAQTGVHRFMQNFDPMDPPSAQASDVQINAAADASSRYSINNVGLPASGPEALPLKGYSIGGGQMWGQRCYVGRVTGTNSDYKSSVTVDTGIGYGPVEITTMSR